MDVYQAAEVAVQIQERLDTLWLLFLTINSTIIGGIIFIQRTFSKLEKSVAILIYAVVSAINFNSISTSIALLKSVYMDMIKFSLSPDEPGYEIVARVASFMDASFYTNSETFMPAIYIVAAILSISAIIFDEKITKTRLDIG